MSEFWTSENTGGANRICTTAPTGKILIVEPLFSLLSNLWAIKPSSGIDRVSKTRNAAKKHKAIRQRKSNLCPQRQCGWWPWEVQMQRLPPTSNKQQKKWKIFTALAHGGLLEVLFRLPQLLSNQPSLPPPPASLDTHTPSNTALTPTHTPPNHFSPSSSVGKVQWPLSFTFRLSVYQLILAWPPREEWKECIDVGVKTIWLCYCGNRVGDHFRGRGAKKSSEKQNETLRLHNCKTKLRSQLCPCSESDLHGPPVDCIKTLTKRCPPKPSRNLSLEISRCQKG